MDLSNGNFPSETMNMSEDSKTVKPQKKSVKSYASGVFQESTIGMVASIITSNSRVRKSFKTILLILCMSGFLYQCITHLVHVYEYPTVVGLDIKRPVTYDFPAFTFCNNNGIKRSFFCAKYPDRCFESNEKFCQKYPKYCDGNKTFVPKKQYYDKEETMTYDEILKYGDNIEEFFLKNRSTFDEGYLSYPFLRFKGDESNVMVCYSLYSVVEKLTGNWSGLEPKKPNITAKLRIKTEPTHTLIFYVDEKEMFVPGNHPGILFTINSPYLSVNPFEKGEFLKPGRAYKIYISMKEESLLEPPYETNCLDYVKTWEANNRTGPRIQEMCQRKCLADYAFKCYKCAPLSILYPSTERICTPEEELSANCDELEDATDSIDFNKCFDSCKDDCRLTKYTYEILEMFDADFGDEQDDEEEERLITVHIYYEDGEVVTMKHAPKYTSVEVFSAIGGFSGVWLGISFMDIIDAVASAFLVSRYAAKNRNKL